MIVVMFTKPGLMSKIKTNKKKNGTVRINTFEAILFLSLNSMS